MRAGRVFILVSSICLGCAFLTAVGAAYAESAASSSLQIVIKKTESQDIKNEDYYFKHLIELVLLKSGPAYEKALLTELPSHLSEKRLLSELHAKKLDLLWAPSSPEMEADFLPVKISLLKELNNYRLLLIRPEMQAEFSRVKTLNDLGKFKGGMNPQWVDADIMQANGLSLVYAVGYEKLFKMLAAKRFDYFSRGLYQVQTEVNYYPGLDLVIEKDLMLHYHNEVYFFVHKDNKALADRLRIGLENAQRDGSFDALFNSIPRYQWGLEELKQQHRRRIIELQPIIKVAAQ